MPGPSANGSLVDALSGLAVPDEPGRVVVFDQIEELFVLYPDRWRDRADLLSQVQAALDHDPLLHFVFVLRDDYLAGCSRSLLSCAIALRPDTTSGGLILRRRWRRS